MVSFLDQHYRSSWRECPSVPCVVSSMGWSSFPPGSSRRECLSVLCDDTGGMMFLPCLSLVARVSHGSLCGDTDGMELFPACSSEGLRGLVSHRTSLFFMHSKQQSTACKLINQRPYY